MVEVIEEALPEDLAVSVTLPAAIIGRYLSKHIKRKERYSWI
jgi:hypothetical protein